MTSSSNEIIHFPFSQKLQIILAEPELADSSLALEGQIEEIWQKAKQKKNLIDSLIFSLSSHSEGKIVGRFVSYRHYIASRYDPEIQKVLQIYPVGVSGLAICNYNILVGIRDASLAHYGGFFECVPSGSIEARAYMQGEVDFIAQAMWELAEEAKISEKKVEEVRPLGLFYSPKDQIYDIGLLIRVNLLEQEMLDSDSLEYPLLQWHTFEEFEEKLAAQNEKFVPLSKMLWHTFRSRNF